MKRIAAHTIILFLSVPGVFGQSPLSLEACREAARREGKIEELYALNALDQEANARLEQQPFLLSISGYGATTYQTDAPNPASMTDFPFVLHASPKFQYHIGFLVKQPIYSGGQRRLKTELNDVEHAMQRTDLDGQRAELDSAVDELFLGILLARKRDEILSRQLNAVRIKQEDARRSYEAGGVYRDAVLSLEAQLSRLEAELAGNEARTAGAIAMLAELTGLPIGADTALELPCGEDMGAFVPDPGLARMDLRARQIELNKQLLRAKARPSLQAVGTIGYGRWPLNFFERRADVYGIVGLTLRVPITDWRAVNKGTARLDAAARQLDLERENAERRRRMALLQYDGEIARYEALLAANERTVARLEELCNELDALCAQGVSSLSDYLTALEQLSAARLDGELYSILKLQQQLLRKRYISKP